jgi:integrase
VKCTIKEINEVIERIRPGQPVVPANYHDPAMPGFYIRVEKTGFASWTVQYKKLGRQKKKAIGDVRLIDRSEAIKAAKAMLAKITLDQLDPHEAKRKRMQANKVTMATLVPLFIENCKARQLRPRTIVHWQLYLTGYYVSPYHHLPADEITKQQMETRIGVGGVVARQSGNRTARSCHTALNVFFNWAIETNKLPENHRNPMTKIKLPPPNKPRERVLDNDEIQLIWKAFEDMETEALHMKSGHLKQKGGSPTNISNARVGKLLFLTGLRRQEIGELQWSEVDVVNKELKIPGERTKNKEELCNPLTDWALEIICGEEKRPDDPYVFLANDGGRGSHNLTSISRSINDRIFKTTGVKLKHWTPHDIRRTVTTRLAALHIPLEVREALTGHISHRPKMDRVYNRYDYWDEKRRAVAMWEANLRAIIEGTAPKIVRPHFGERKKGDTE